ncbi:MAG: PQQ-binding-like beta-propeller repeat protein [Planctomycetales bacterium]|nr:PQQ-binding-like beta-propeller repeat protein [Planctomycetales bacterium]
MKTWRGTGAFVFGLIGVGLWLSSVSRAASPEWPQFRGPDGQGHSDAKNLPTTWSDSENVAWKTSIPGRGWSSPVIAGDQIWLTTGVESPISEEEKARRTASNTGNQPLTVSGPLSMRAVCVDRNTGALRHDIELMKEAEPDWTHSLNTFASPTPVLADGRLYCHFGTNGTACLDTTSGKVLWTNRSLKVRHENGAGSSPVLWRDRLIFHCDGSDVQYIVALDTKTGEVAWRTDRTGKMNDNPQLKKAYGTPLIVEMGGRDVLASPAADWLYGYDPATGRELWKMPYGKLGFSIVPRPVAGNGMLFMCTSFMQSELLAVNLNAPGTPEIAWQYGKQAPSMPSPLLVGDEVYIVGDKGIVTCLDARTGEVHWTERLPGNYSSSPLFADGKIYISNRDGQTTVLAPGREFQQLAVNQLDGAIMASPAAVGDSLYVRTEGSLYRIAKR